MEARAARFVVAFAARDGSRQGFVWVDERTKQITRLRMDDKFSRDVRFVPVTFAALSTTLWLPSSATVTVRFAGGELHSVHRFSDYHLEGSDKTAGRAAKPEMELDAIEVLLDRRSGLSKPARRRMQWLPCERPRSACRSGLSLATTWDWRSTARTIRRAELSSAKR